MKTYRYTARDLAGEKKEGIKEANASNDILAYLRQEGYIPVSIEEVNEKVSIPKQQRSRKKRIKSADLATFCWQFSTMIEGGIGITTALETIASDLENRYLGSILLKIADRIKKGDSFVVGVSEFPKVFNRLARAIMLAGETSGNLADSVKRLAQYYENRDKLAKRVKTATAYPVFVFGFIILILVVIMTFIVPRFRIIFDQIGGELPVFTRWFMGVYDVMRQNILYFFGAIILTIIFSFYLHSKTKKGHRFFSVLLLKLPLLGKVFSQAFISTFCRTVSTLLAAGVSILEVFDILSEMTHNDVIKEAVLTTKERIIEGQGVSDSMTYSDFFPNMVVKMTEVGEETGSMPTVLDKTADYYERKVEATIATIMSLIEPIMIVTIGAIVLVVVLALYMPIFSITDFGQ